MRVSITRPAELGPAELSSWREWQLQGPGLDNPFLAPDFALAMERVRPNCEVAVFEDEEGVSGFLAYERRRNGIGRAIGLGVSDCQGVVFRPGSTVTPAALLGPAKLTVWEFDHLLASQAPLDGRDYIRTGSPIMDLVDGYQSYRDARRSLARPTIKPTERKMRKLGREHGELRLDYDCRDPAMLRLLMKWKSAHYRRTGAADRFGWPWLCRLVEEAFDTRTPEYGGLLSTLYAGDTPVAIDFGLRSRRVYARWFAAYNGEFGQFSPGLIMLMRLADAAAADGLEKIDLGKGSEPYKSYFASSQIPLAEGWISRRSLRSALYRMRHAPPRAAKAFVKSHPELRRRARDIRDGFNRWRRYGLRSTTSPSGAAE